MLYNVIERVNPLDITAPRKFYAVANADRVADLRMVAKTISRETNFSTAEVQSAIESFLMVIPRLLVEGYTVKLGEFGSFRLSISSQGAATREEFNPSLINGVNLIFRAGKEFDKELRDVEFQKVSPSV